MDFYFGRLNIAGGYEGDKAERLLAALRAGIIINKYNNNWTVYDVSMWSRGDSDAQSFIVGRLTRYHDTKEDTFDDETKRPTQMSVPRKVYGEGRFFIHVKSMLIAYSPDSGIRESSFRRYLAEIIHHGLGGILVHVEIDPIIEAYQFIRDVKSLDTVRDISVWIKPSNPGYKDQWKEVDEELQEEKVEEFHTRYKLKDKVKAAIPEGGFLEKILLMVSDGYGNAKARGTKDGEMKTIRSGQAPKQVEFDSKEVDDAQVAERLADDLEAMSSQQIPYDGNS